MRNRLQVKRTFDRRGARAEGSQPAPLLVLTRCRPKMVKIHPLEYTKRLILDAFNELEMAYPKTTAKRRQELKAIRKLL